MASVYPPGLPFFYAVAHTVLRDWEKAARLVSLVHALVALVFCYRLGRTWRLSRALAATVTAVLAVNPLSLRYFELNMSDAPAMTWALGAVYFACKSHKRSTYSALAGVCFGLGIAVRPTNVLVLPTLLITLPKKVRTLFLFVLLLAFVSVPMLLFNTIQFGGPFRLGYGEILWRFNARYFLPRAWHFLLWISRFFTPCVFLGVIAAFALRKSNKTARLPFFAGMTWFSSFFLFYSFYWFSKDAWWSLRFLLPGIPGLLGASAQGFAEVINRFHRKQFRFAASLLTAIAVLASSVLWVSRLHVVALREEENKWRQAAQEAGARYRVVLCGELSGPVFFYSKSSLIRFDRLREPELTFLLSRLPPQSKVGALLAPGELRLITRLFPGLLGACVRTGPFHRCDVNLPL